MGIVLGPNRYGKAESRVVRIVRDTERHEIRDLNVSTSLYGDFAAAHTDGDQSQVLPTDTQKNTAFAFAKKHGVTSPEDYAIALGTRLLEATPAADGAVVQVEEYAWDRIPVNGFGHDHAFVRRGGEVRTAAVEVTSAGPSVTVRARGPGGPEVHRLGVQGFPPRRVHDAPRRRRPHPRDRAPRGVAPPGRRAARLEHDVRSGAGAPARDLRDDLQPRPAGDALRDGSVRARGPRRRST